jgi:hypothetical protein
MFCSGASVFVLTKPKSITPGTVHRSLACQMTASPLRELLLTFSITSPLLLSIRTVAGKHITY